MKSRALLGTSFTMALLLGAGSAAMADSTIRVQLNADVRSTDPGVNRDADTDVVVAHMVEGLVAYGEDTTVRPMLAEKVDVSTDDLTYTFTLRKGVKFHNGAEMTADDVLWSWIRYMDPKTEWRCLSAFDGRSDLKVVSVSAPDKHTVVFTLEKPTALFLPSLARTDCGQAGILHKDSLKADGTWDKPIGTGPYQLGEWKRGEYFSAKAFPGYASREGERDGLGGGKKALVGEIRFMVVPDASTAKAALLAGDLDLIPDLSNADAIELQKNDAVSVVVGDTMEMSGLLIQTRDPVLSNVKMREAIAAALDYDQLVAAVTQGLSKPNNSIIPTSSPYANEKTQKGWSYDPEKVKQLLAEAGYDGKPIVMLTNKHYTSMYDGAIVAQAMLEAAGIKVELEVMEWGAQLDQYTAGSYQMMSFSYSARLDPALSFDSIMGSKDKQPRKVWDDPAAQAVLAKSMVAADKAERQALFDDLDQRFKAAVPMIPLYNGADVFAVSKRVEGYKSWPGAIPRLWSVSAGE